VLVHVQMTAAMECWARTPDRAEAANDGYSLGPNSRLGMDAILPHERVMDVPYSRSWCTISDLVLHTQAVCQ
jgi:hypothetical protein